MVCFSKSITSFLLLLQLPSVIAVTSAYIELINGTPYDWFLVSKQSQRMTWNPNDIVQPGTSAEAYVRWKMNHKDAAAEATYHIDNPNNPESFTVRALQNPTRIEIVYGNNLTSLNNPQNTVINLGYLPKGAHPFVLAGNGISQPYVGTNPPTAWMQATLSTIGDKPLRGISMPLSHDSGASVVSHSLKGPGTLHNTQTQYGSVYQQLMHGVRVLDIRPMLYNGEWLTYHGSLAMGSMWGATGQSIPGLVNDINRFTNDFPGELIILDVNHDSNAHRKYQPFNEEDWSRLYQSLGEIRDLWTGSPEGGMVKYDLSMEPLSSFVTQGSRSSVLIRLPCGAPLPDQQEKSLENRNVNGWCTKEGSDNDDLALDVVSSSSSPNTLELETEPEDEEEEDEEEENNVGHVGNSNTTLTTPILFSNSSSTPSSSSNTTTKIQLITLRSTFPTTAFIPSTRLPITSTFSHTSSPRVLSSTQLSSLSTLKPSPLSPIHKTSWILMQPIFYAPDFANPGTSILGYAIGAHRELFGADGVWRGVTGGGGGKPNWIEVDGVRNSDVAALGMAINIWGEE